jgi:hypothetical protein
MVGLCRVLACLVFVSALVTAPHAFADNAPWAQGVTDEQKAAAKKLLDEGNALLLDKKYVEALDKYTVALTHWDHPAIRFNMVRCLIQLQRNIEAFDNLKLALKYGATPLEETVYNEALAYEKLLATQVADITVTCQQAGVTLTLDGQPLATCPATETRRVIPGQHQVVGKGGKDLLPKTVELFVVGGKQQSADIKLDPLAKGAVIVHRWPTWIPWSVFSGGLVLAGVGVGLQVWAGQQMKSYDRFVDDRCTGNCTADDLDDIAYLKSGAETKSRIGVGAMVVGGAAVVGGAVMVYLNRGRTVYPESLPAIVPMQGGAGVSWTGRF